MPSVLPSVIYDHIASATNTAISFTDLASQWGDEVVTGGTGLLSTMQFWLDNSSSSAGPLLAVNVSASFFDAVTSARLGAVSTSINFGTGLPTGCFTLVSVTALAPLLINLPVTDVIVSQKVLTETGTANRLGVAPLNPPPVGTSPAHTYISSPTISSTTIGTGFFNLSVRPNPGYQLAVAPRPPTTVPRTWSSLEKLYQSPALFAVAVPTHRAASRLETGRCSYWRRKSRTAAGGIRSATTGPTDAPTT